MRRTFADELYRRMEENPDIYLITGDLGYKMWDKIAEAFPTRFINAGASEQAMLGIGVGLALSGKIPFCYSITPFILCRPYEWLRNYLHHEQIPVKLVGAGRGKDYDADGFSHWAEDMEDILKPLNIAKFVPDTKDEIPTVLEVAINNNKPSFISLSR